MPANIPNIPEPKQQLLNEIVGQLSETKGVLAVVLGGSYASGTQHEKSDIDIGLYYDEANPFSIEDIRSIARKASPNADPTVTGFYEWGAWVNGGAWIHTQLSRIDFLYRNIAHVQRTIAEAQEGIIHHDYDQQPTNGFYSVIYLAETQICIPLYDPDGVIATLKRQVEIYPPKLKQRIIRDSLWAAEFTLYHARGFADQGDIYNTVGCLTRVLSNLTQLLFAVNERYFIREKKVMDDIAAFSILPPGYIQQVNHLLSKPGSTEQELKNTVSELEQIWYSVIAISGEEYAPTILN